MSRPRRIGSSPAVASVPRKSRSFEIARQRSYKPSLRVDSAASSGDRRSKGLVPEGKGLQGKGLDCNMRLAKSPWSVLLTDVVASRDWLLHQVLRYGGV